MDAQEGFAESDKKGNVQDGVGSQLMQLNPVDKQKSTQKLMDGE